MKGALLLSLPLTLGSCIADSVSLRVSCNIAPDDECVYSEGNECYLDGALNLKAQENLRYHAVLLVANGLKARARDVPPQSEPNGVTVEEFEIEITDSSGKKPTFARSLPNPFTVQATGTVEPGEEAPVGGDLLPPPYVAGMLDAQGMPRFASVRLSIIARGKTWGGVEVESAPWPWSVRLTSRSTQQADAECIPPEEGAASSICALGQDQWVGSCMPVDDGT